MKKTCEVCKKKIFQYVCPSCEIVYCSLECYQNHNDNCVNNFLEKHVNENIRNNALTEFDKKEFKFKLKKFYEDNAESDFTSECKILNERKDEKKSKARYDRGNYEHVKCGWAEELRGGDEQGKCDNEEDEEDEHVHDGDEERGSLPQPRDDDNGDDANCEETASSESEAAENSEYLNKWCISNKRYKVLTELALKDELKLENLNKTEKKQFFSFLKNNDMNLYIDKFEPWWLECVIKRMEVPEHICCNKDVNQNVIFIIIEIIYSYCYLLRIYYKTISNREFCYLMLYLAVSLNRLYLPEENALNTINNLFERILEKDDLAREKNVLYNVITDVSKIISLKELILRCLYETKRKFKKEIKKLNTYKDTLTSNLKKAKILISILQEQKNFKYVNKKITFLYSYANYHYDRFEEIRLQLTRFYSEQRIFVQSNENREIVLSK
ncbi:zinc finger protein [Plasmodium brasilianum]|uniref:Zinc finger protein, putative n=2 Tax=Plasmodium (Plasmodium) TaxID=418103 RepID=A0A1A8VVJ2_PLAMA|nr:zinc finger protein, putative [Plasmodium malariae]KAI4839360.1 zinc finger protein [Plasmodium brasilianum]SBS83705.1 zinc finger protein, putative [Plasmodium malariae]SBT87776.1 zinc finger protein, putative [Plasmodium malariae]